WATASSSDLKRQAELLNVDQNELGRLERGEPDEDVDDPPVDVVLRVVLPVALDQVRLLRRAPLEHPLPEPRVHERADVEPDRRPQRLVVGLENHPLRTAIETLLDKQ